MFVTPTIGASPTSCPRTERANCRVSVVVVFRYGFELGVGVRLRLKAVSPTARGRINQECREASAASEVFAAQQTSTATKRAQAYFRRSLDRGFGPLLAGHVLTVC